MVDREWRFYLDDMARFARKALKYTDGLDRVSFARNELVYDAVLRNLELIGEAAGHVPVEIREAHPHIPWRMIVATRNRLIHAYLGIDSDTIWNLVEEHLPDLVHGLERMQQEL
ncbi:MAG: HepT-like ribonuclease domain-containing protein [Pseudomonadota bacterium]